MLVSVQEASSWASEYIGRTVTPTNITYLVQYGKIHKYPDETRKVKVNKEELQEYYDEFVIRKQDSWKNKLGKDLDWGLSFDHLREVDTTKHVHRLHPYKGKFIPQLVEYFLDENINHEYHVTRMISIKNGHFLNIKFQIPSITKYYKQKLINISKIILNNIIYNSYDI